MEYMEIAFHQTIRFFEEGFPEGWRSLDEEEYLADWNSIARVLAVYCPTLEYVFFREGPECRISRTESGSIVVTGGEERPFSGYTSKKEYFPLLSSAWRID